MTNSEPLLSVWLSTDLYRAVEPRIYAFAQVVGDAYRELRQDPKGISVRVYNNTDAPAPMHTSVYFPDQSTPMEIRNMIVGAVFGALLSHIPDSSTQSFSAPTRRSKA